MTSGRTLLRRLQRRLPRLLMSAPLPLYAIGAGWLLRERFLQLTHTGRRTGRPRRVVLEVVRHDTAGDTYVVAAAWGEKAQWYRNIVCHPEVQLTVGRRRAAARARRLSIPEAEGAMRVYAAAHPFLVRALAQFVTRRRAGSVAEAVDVMAHAMPFVALEVVEEPGARTTEHGR